MNCYKCKFRENLPGSAHSVCKGYPDDLKEIVENLEEWGFESIETCDSHYEPGVEFVGHLKDIENWAGEFNRFGITDDDIVYEELVLTN